ncbi:hypothetical protein AVEN_21902-1 [Araneus ventricosus]|uniref:Uncharacterized protein n=1 Tax=Araneus ventricosus TaxID=182803 RepID=A0A4Y2N5I6_ARAVE|nr:hypothetical protein AVEN_21902-1 [Araneus ventricosus]
MKAYEHHRYAIRVACHTTLIFVIKKTLLLYTITAVNLVEIPQSNHQTGIDNLYFYMKAYDLDMSSSVVCPLSMVLPVHCLWVNIVEIPQPNHQTDIDNLYFIYMTSRYVIKSHTPTPPSIFD